MKVSKTILGAKSLSLPLPIQADDKVISSNSQVILQPLVTTLQDHRHSRVNLVPLAERNHPTLQTQTALPANPLLAKVERCVIQHLLGSNRRNNKRHPNCQRSIHRRKTPLPPTALTLIVLRRAWILRQSEARSPRSFLPTWWHLTLLPQSHAIAELFAHRQTAARMRHRLGSLATICCNEKPMSSTNTGTRRR